MVIVQIFIGLLIAISAFFLKRLIDDNDKSHDKQSSAINSNTKEIKKLSSNLSGIYNQFLEVERIIKEHENDLDKNFESAESHIENVRRDMGQAIMLSREDIKDSIRSLEKETVGRVVLLEERNDKLINALKLIAAKRKKSA